jgi:pyruvate-formate lyase-activating enzyme
MGAVHRALHSQTPQLVLLDIKNWNPEAHFKLTGTDLVQVLAFAQRLSAFNRPMWLRYVLVPSIPTIWTASHS